MLTQPTIEKLNTMKLTVMAEAFREQLNCPDMSQLSFEERFGLLVDHQMLAIENKRLQTRLKSAKLRFNASIEDLDFRADRGLDRSQIISLTTNQWVKNSHNLFITGPTGAGKSYIACALAQKAAWDGHTVLYQRLPRLLDDLCLARHDGRYYKLTASLAKCQVLILDDLLITSITREEQKELLEVIEDRYGRGSTIVTSQLPVKAWHSGMQDPTLADAIMDRLVHNAYKIEVKGDSMRKRQSTLDQNLKPVTK